MCDHDLKVEFLEDLKELPYRIYYNEEYKITRIQVLHSKYMELLKKWEAK